MIKTGGIAPRHHYRFALYLGSVRNRPSIESNLQSLNLNSRKKICKFPSPLRFQLAEINVFIINFILLAKSKKTKTTLICIPVMCVGSLVRHARNVTMRALGQRAKAMESLAKIKKEHL